MVQLNADYTNGQTTPAPFEGVVREAVGVFTDTQSLQDAIRDLEGTAFPRQDISVMGGREELEKVFGASSVNPAYAMDNSDTPRQAPARPEEATIGTAAMIGGGAYIGAMTLALTAGAVAFPAIVAAAVIGGVGGGSIGAVMTALIGNRHNKHLEEQIEKGGLLLWVRTPDAERESIAQQIMRNNGAYDVHVHDIA